MSAAMLLLSFCLAQAQAGAMRQGGAASGASSRWQAFRTPQFSAAFGVNLIGARQDRLFAAFHTVMEDLGTALPHRAAEIAALGPEEPGSVQRILHEYVLRRGQEAKDGGLAGVENKEVLRRLGVLDEARLIAQGLNPDARALLQRAHKAYYGEASARRLEIAEGIVAAAKAWDKAAGEGPAGEEVAGSEASGPRLSGLANPQDLERDLGPLLSAELKSVRAKLKEGRPVMGVLEIGAADNILRASALTPEEKLKAMHAFARSLVILGLLEDKNSDGKIVLVLDQMGVVYRGQKLYHWRPGLLHDLFRASIQNAKHLRETLALALRILESAGYKDKRLLDHLAAFLQTLGERGGGLLAARHVFYDGRELAVMAGEPEPGEPSVVLRYDSADRSFLEIGKAGDFFENIKEGAKEILIEAQPKGAEYYLTLDALGGIVDLGDDPAALSPGTAKVALEVEGGLLGNDPRFLEGSLGAGARHAFLEGVRLRNQEKTGQSDTVALEADLVPGLFHAMALGSPVELRLGPVDSQAPVIVVEKSARGELTINGEKVEPGRYHVGSKPGSGGVVVRGAGVEDRHLELWVSPMGVWAIDISQAGASAVSGRF